jgi:Response regulator containing CheY-like receiver, AAA-type ATPase, and DNA-binding domains
MPNTIALVVDHSRSMRKYICAILQEELNFRETHEAENAEDALRFLASNQSVKWIFSAWEMPGMSSPDFLGDLRKRNAHVVLVTGEEEISARQIAIRENVADYLCTPFSPDQLVQKVRRLTGLAERRATERIKATMPCEVDLGFDPFHVYSAELVDISLGGCRVKTSQLAPNTGHLNDLATITFLPEGKKPLRLDGQIRRVESGDCGLDGFGCVQVAFEFVHNEPEQQTTLESYIELCKAQAASSFQ